MIICLYPYMTKDHGLRAYIDPKEYWGALGSRENLNVFINRRLIEAGFRPDYFDEYGYFNFNLGRRHDEIIPRDQKKRRTGPDSFYRIDPVAFEELSHLIEKCRSKGIRIVAYYYPIYIESLDAPAFRAYKEKIGSLFRKEDVVWDCNTEEYLPFRMDRGNYNPTYHLSDRGAQFVLEDIQRKLDRHLGRGDRARPGDRSEKNLQRVDA